MPKIFGIDGPVISASSTAVSYPSRRVWILDEPLTGLDPRSAHELKQMMREHADAGNAVLFSTHVLEVAEKLCDRIAIIHHGRQVFLGTLEELKAAYPDQTLENIFLEITEHA